MLLKSHWIYYDLHFFVCSLFYLYSEITFIINKKTTDFLNYNYHTINKTNMKPFMKTFALCAQKVFEELTNAMMFVLILVLSSLINSHHILNSSFLFLKSFIIHLTRFSAIFTWSLILYKNFTWEDQDLRDYWSYFDNCKCNKDSCSGPPAFKSGSCRVRFS